ncbi:hypothetical protein [Kurthia massiliensis]|uniref:hypothetical protein n=1 Tax=Kurthia massiliensis TaxID=1033739 RepID=UPI000289DCAC|nr:hypothetical protein [Kurthia massiliensis]
MRHHIEQLLLLEERLSDELQDTFQRDINAHVATTLQLPMFKHVSVVRQLLAQCASVHIGVYESIPKREMAAAIATLRQYLHRTYFQMPQLDALCYFEQWYEAEDARLVVRGQARDELKFAIAYTMTWLETPMQLDALVDYLAPLAKQFETYYPAYSFKENVRLALDELVDVEQIVSVTIDAHHIARYELNASHFGSLIMRLYHANRRYTLLTEPLQKQLQHLCA